MGKKRHKSLPGPAALDASRAGRQPNTPAGQPHDQLPAAGQTPASRRQATGGKCSLTERIAALHRLTGWRLWAVNLATAIIIPVLLLASVEGGLRLFGYGYPCSFCLRQAGSSVYVENDRFLWQFYSKKANLHPNPFAVASPKPPETVRVAILGESAAAGTPEPAYNFGRILERMLRHQYPGRRFEVINAAMRGINSHILLPVARDCCARLEPDVLVVYMGNNETVGLYAPGPHSGRLISCRPLLRGLQWVRATRLGELLEPLLFGLAREGVSADEQDDQFFQQHRVAADDPRRGVVYDHFRANLGDICAAAHRDRAALVLMTVPVNLQDFPPLGSLHRTGISDEDLLRWQRAFDAGVEAEAAGRNPEAITNFQSAAAIDGHHAELHFHLARCWSALGQFDNARREFTLARDWDALQFRADSHLNDIIRQTAARLPGRATWLVDADRALAEADPEEHSIPGNRLFNDHVHPSFDGDYLLAKTLFPAVCEALRARGQVGQPSSLPSEKSPREIAAAGKELRVLSRDECAAQLAFTRLNEGRIANDMLKATSFPPFTSQLDHARRQKAAEQRTFERFGKLTTADYQAASTAYLAAMRQFPDDWRLPYNFARLRLMARDYPGAIQQFETAQRLLPHWGPIQVGKSSALCAAGRRDEALSLLHGLLARYPQSQEIKANIAAIQSQGLARK